jgi:hypothetical protein
MLLAPRLALVGCKPLIPNKGEIVKRFQTPLPPNEEAERRQKKRGEATTDRYIQKSHRQCEMFIAYCIRTPSATPFGVVYTTTDLIL